MPTQAKLADEFGVERGAVRQALRILQSEHLLTNVSKGSPATVAPRVGAAAVGGPGAAPRAPAAVDPAAKIEGVLAVTDATKAVVAEGDVLFLVAEEDGAILGTIFVNTRTDYFTKATVAYVEVLAVSEAAAGKGIGRALMEAAEGWARERGFVRVDLAVFANNRRARAFYEHLGYHAETMRYVKGVSGER